MNRKRRAEMKKTSEGPRVRKKKVKKGEPEEELFMAEAAGDESSLVEESELLATDEY